ncbi:unnamed protein product [Paramecium sonneborni]|uniref:Uncharacterized protein n=1 Tax=Paramecium sonneborni TaxID=65129 RepID=A0A8S1QXG4_9CILI|nr:unnamed protein product [Paramecium sonneborni]
MVSGQQRQQQICYQTKIMKIEISVQILLQYFFCQKVGRMSSKEDIVHTHYQNSYFNQLHLLNLQYQLKNNQYCFYIYKVLKAYKHLIQVGFLTKQEKILTQKKNTKSIIKIQIDHCYYIYINNQYDFNYLIEL